ncbi:MAG TPA: hypothetical protein VFD08_00950 [Clostridia bacterium]|nr:hypothetical protein [Clostridia bacterium]
MKTFIRKCKRLGMSPIERMIDHLRYGEFKKAGKVAKKGISNIEGKELAQSVTDKLAFLDRGQREAFFDEFEKVSEEAEDILPDEAERAQAKNWCKHSLEKDDLFLVLGLAVAFCFAIRRFRNR